MSGGIGVTVEQGVLKPCRGCGQQTTIRVDEVPGHYGCVPRKVRIKLSFRFLDDLRDKYPPKRRADGKMRDPYFEPVMPEITDMVAVTGWNWERDGYEGPQVVLDRTAAYPSSIASLDYAHSALVHTPDETRWAGCPGFYKVARYRWTEPGLPHPLGGATPGADESGVWVPHPRVELLQRLADQRRYPDGFILDSYTSGRDGAGQPRSCRLTAWSNHMRDVRAQVITDYGRWDERASDGSTDGYRYVKERISQARTLMCGTREVGKSRTYQASVRVRRPDWGWAIEDQSACTLWRNADEINQTLAAAGRPDLHVLALGNVDEIRVPLEAYGIVRETVRPGLRTPLPIDDDGVKYGTYKAKRIEQ